MIATNRCITTRVYRRQVAPASGRLSRGRLAPAVAERLVEMRAREWVETRLGFESQLYDFVGFPRARLPSPLAQRILRNLHQQRVTTLDFNRLYLAIGSNHHVGAHGALYVHRPSQTRVLRIDLRCNFARTFAGFLCTNERRRENGQRQKSNPPECDTVFHEPVVRTQDMKNVVCSEDYLGNGGGRRTRAMLVHFRRARITRCNALYRL